MISEFIDRQATNADLFELEDVETGEKRQYRIVSKATVTQPGTDLNKATLDPILNKIQSFGEFAKMAVLITDWNAVSENGIYMANSGANAPVSGEWHMGLVMHHNASYSVQRVYAFASTRKWYERSQMNGSWSEWAEVAGTDFARQGITDSGGSSSTGYWVKFDDGTMKCYKRTTIQANAQTAMGGLYRSDYISLGDFPVPFTTLVDIKPSIWNANASSVYMWPTSVLGPSNSSAGSIAVIAGSKYGGLAECMYTAVGRWK